MPKMLILTLYMSFLYLKYHFFPSGGGLCYTTGMKKSYTVGLNKKQKSINGKRFTLGHACVFFLFLTVMVFTAAYATSHLIQTYQFAEPIVAKVTQVTFSHRKATALVSIPSIPSVQPVDITDAPYEEIVEWANHQGCIEVFLNDQNVWQPYEPHTPLGALFIGLFLITFSTLFSSFIPLFKQRIFRLFFAAIHLGIFWTIHLLNGTFQWFFIIQILPIMIAWFILNRLNVSAECSTGGCYSRSYPPYAWGGRIIMLIVGLVFCGVGGALQYFVLDSGRASIERLQARREVTLTPHLTKTTSSDSGRNSSTTTHLLVSYLQEDGTPYYVYLNSDEEAHLTEAQEKIRHMRFRRLCNGSAVLGSVSCSDPTTVYPCTPTLKDSAVLNETFTNFFSTHFPLLLSVPFLIFGLLMLSMVGFELLSPRHKLVYNAKRDWMPQIWYRAILWVLFPTTLAIAGVEWFHFYGHLPKVPTYGTLVLFSPAVGILLLFIRQHIHLRHSPIYSLTYQKELTGITFTINPPQVNPPIVLCDDVHLTPTAQGENQWRLAWISIPKHLQIHLEDGTFFHLS